MATANRSDSSGRERLCPSAFIATPDRPAVQRPPDLLFGNGELVLRDSSAMGVDAAAAATAATALLQ
ncbi:hypothetical protein EJ110_NYTH24273 [Nymphaea thermarum]|nr:hypothetical protein EJ110_NYTH24273 [Nymphaea thermarum]